MKKHVNKNFLILEDIKSKLKTYDYKFNYNHVTDGLKILNNWSTTILKNNDYNVTQTKEHKLYLMIFELVRHEWDKSDLIRYFEYILKMSAGTFIHFLSNLIDIMHTFENSYDNSQFRVVLFEIYQMFRLLISFLKGQAVSTQELKKARKNLKESYAHYLWLAKGAE